jgi:carbamate kinase
MMLARAYARHQQALSSFTNKRPFHVTSSTRDRIVVAVGGNALQRRGERLTIENMLKAAADMAPTIAALAREHQVVLTHGNGPQVGELALERSAAS